MFPTCIFKPQYLFQEQSSQLRVALLQCLQLLDQIMSVRGYEEQDSESWTKTHHLFHSVKSMPPLLPLPLSPSPPLTLH